MSAFAIVQINVTNKDKYQDYLNQVTPTVKKFNGKKNCACSWHRYYWRAIDRVVM